MKKELLESYEQIRKIRQEIPLKVKHQDTRDYLELVIKNNFLEAQNVQLLLNLQLQARTISQLKSMILRQQQFIQESHLDSSEGKVKVSNEKQFDEFEEGEDYKKLLLASPETSKSSKTKIEEVPEEQSQEAMNIEEPMDPTTKEEAYLEDESEGFKDIPEDQAEENAGKHGGKGEELKEISVTGVAAFKIEGKGVGIPEKEKKQQATKSKGVKENKNAGKGNTAAQPANLSVMGSKIAGKKGAAKPKFK